MDKCILSCHGIRPSVRIDKARRCFTLVQFQTFESLLTCGDISVIKVGLVLLKKASERAL